MKNKILKTSALSLVGVSMLVSTSCTDLLDQQPIDWFGSESFWSTADDYLGNPVALNQMFRANYAANILFWAGELRAGQFTTNLINGSGSLNGDIIENNYDIAHPQFSNFMNTPGFITDINELIYRCENSSEGILTEKQRDGLLAYAYGMRAYTYFLVYKMWGGAVIRTEPDVLFGETNPDNLYKARSTAQQTLDQIKSDVNKSIELFQSSGMDYPMNSMKGSAKDYYWNRWASEMLAGEVYLWSGKVTTGDHTAAGASDVAIAKQHFLNVVNSGQYSLYNDWFGIWTTPHNSESIFAICYTNTTDGVYDGSIAGQVMWSKSAGAATTAWSIQGETGFDKREYNEETGTFSSASYFQYFSTDPKNRGTQYSNWVIFNPSPNRYMWKNAMYYQFDQADGRTAMWFPQWYISEDDINNKVYAVLDFDPTKYDLQGTFLQKFIPSKVNDTATTLSYLNDGFIYRLTLAYTYLAEIANYEGNYNEIATWLNPVRQRAYGSKWDESKYGFQHTNFAENEAIILREKNKEFIMEGQRWFDLVRMTTVKDGAMTDHMVFQPQGCIGYGLDPVSNPWMVEAGPQGAQSVVETMTPVLSTSEAHKLLWPIDRTLLGSDPLIKQNPGYASELEAEEGEE